MVLERVEMQFQVEFEDTKQAEIVLKAIEPELVSSPSERSTVNLDLRGNLLCVDIQAKDTTSLRASVNSYTRWILLSLDVIDVK